MRQSHSGFFWLAACVLLAALLGFGYALLSRPYAAQLKLVSSDSIFATREESSAFSAFITSREALSQSTGSSPNDKPLPPSGSCALAVELPGTIVGTVQSHTAGEALQLGSDFERHILHGIDSWNKQRSEEIDRQLAAIQHQMQEVRSRFTPFNEALGSADIRTVQAALTQNLASKETAVASLAEQLAASEETTENKSSAIPAANPVLQQLQQELAVALTRFTEEHPKVKELRRSIEALKKETLKQASTGSATVDTKTAAPNHSIAALRKQLDQVEAAKARAEELSRAFTADEVDLTRLQLEYGSLEAKRSELIRAKSALANTKLANWQRAGELQLFRITQPRRLTSHSGLGALGGCGFALLCVLVQRRRAKVVRSAGTLCTTSGLPVLASVPDLQQLGDGERDYWALQTLEVLRKKAGAKRRSAFICGFISAHRGEGCSTLMNLVARAGSRIGHRVLVLSRPTSTPLLAAPVSESHPNGLFAPECITANDTPAVARYSVAPNTVEASFQRQWEHAFETWRNEEDALILVELPPASTSEALLLSPSLPNVVWLSNAGRTETKEVRKCVTALTNTGCNLIGAILNRGAVAFATIAFLLLVCTRVAAQQAVSNDPRTNTLSAPTTSRPVLAPWQQRLTLGPGDVFDISLYGQIESMRSGIVVGPDGRFSYLQAKDVEATGLTVDELRAKLEEILGKYHLAPRVVIVPAAYRSKKYFMLGNVITPGAFVIERPLTIMEAVARSKGFVSAGARSSLTLADLNRAFLVRRQPTGGFAREPIDFEKLFLRGDLSENKQIAPDDYLYFPPVGSPEVYVLGEVGGVGPVPYTKELTVLGAIASRGGYTDAAFRQKILVIRGSLQNPETFIVDSAKALRAASPDFLLQPRDIIYVSRKPWAKAEEILKAASSDFVRAVVVTWTGREVNSIFE